MAISAAQYPLFSTHKLSWCLPAVSVAPLLLAHSDPVAAFPAIKSAILNTFSQYEVMSEREIQLDR